MAATQGSATLGRTGLAIVDWAERLSVKPVALGAAVATAIFATGLTLGSLSDWLPDAEILSLTFWAHVRGWFDLLASLLIGYAVASTVWIVHGTLRDWDRLAPAMEASPGESARARAELVRFDGSSTHLLAALAVAAGLATNFIPSNWPEGRPALGDPFFLWVGVRTALAVWVVTLAIYVDLTLARRFSRLGSGLVRVDLLETRPLGGFGRRGLRSVLLLMGFSILLALMTLAPFGREAMAGGIVLSVGFGTLAFLAPVRGAHLRVREARDAELARVRAAIRERVPVANAGDTGLADLLAWEARLERVHTWPLDAGTLARFVLYVAVGVGSWVGGAVVERALGAALD